jgi:hypothetical protein
MALGERLAEQSLGRTGMKTHMGIQAVIMAATKRELRGSTRARLRRVKSE